MRIPRGIYLLVSVLMMICMGTVYTWSVFRIPIEEHFGVGVTMSGIPYMVSLLSYSIFMWLTGKRLDRYNQAVVILVGAVLSTSGFLISSQVTSIEVLSITYGLIVGAGVGIVYGVPLGAIGKMFPEYKGVAVGVVLGGFGISPLLTAPLATMLIGKYGVMNTFLVLGVLFFAMMMLMSIPYWFYHPERYLAQSGQTNALEGMSTVEMKSTRAFKVLYVNFAIGAMIGLTMIGITSVIGTGYVGMSSANVGVWISFFAICNALGRPTFGWLIDRFKVGKVMVFSYCMITFAAVSMIFMKTGTTWVFVGAFALFWFNLGGWLSIAPATTMKQFGLAHYSKNFGVVFTAYGVGAVIGVYASGVMLDVFKHAQVVFVFVIIMSNIGNLIVFLNRKKSNFSSL